MKQPTLRWGLAGALLISMTGCLEPSASTGSDSSSGGGYSGGDQANGGMGGSGAGTVSGYGSIIINGIRKFNIDGLPNEEAHSDPEFLVDPADFFLDGIPTGYTGNHQLPIGIVVEYLLSDLELGDNLSSGTATEVHGWHQVIGPVTAMPTVLEPNVIEVLGQRVLFNSTDTHMAHDNSDAPVSFSELNLELGTVVALSGFRDKDYVLHATRLARADSAPQWQLIGRTSDLAAALAGTTPTFNIHGQPVSRNVNTAVTGCEEISAWQKVRVTKNSPSSTGSLLEDVTKIHCLPDGIELLKEVPEAPDELPVSFTGIVEKRTLLDDGQTELVVDGQSIVVADETTLLQMLEGTVETTIEVVDDLLRGELLSGDIEGKRIDVNGRLRDGDIHAEHVIVLSPLVPLFNELVCNSLSGWLVGCEDSLVYTESPLNEAMLAASGGAESEASISVLGLQPEKLSVDLGEVAPTKEFSRHVFAALDSSASGIEPEQPAHPGMLVASLQ